jgi:hypothetical protein
MQRERLDVRKVFAALRAAETHLKTIFGATAIHQSQSEEFEKGSREALSSGILNAANHDRLTLGQSKHNTSANQNKGTRLGGPSDSSRGNMPTRRKASSLNLPAALILHLVLNRHADLHKTVVDPHTMRKSKVCINGWICILCRSAYSNYYADL